MTIAGLTKFKDLGLLLLRLGVGLSFVFIHGLPKLQGGPERWARLGGSMKNLGLDFAPEFWGFMAMFAEFFGAILLIAGLFFIPTSFLLMFTMLVAMVQHLTKMDPWGTISHPMELFFVFLGLMLIGPGKYSLDYLFKRKKTIVTHDNETARV